jgi:hypothetical protein
VGIPQNWFPSAISFLVSLAAFYLFYFSKKVSKQNGSVYLLIAFFSLLASFIFGSNIYSYKDGVSRMLDIFLFGGSVVTGMVALLS